jgi:hypothetical protein
MRIGVKDTIDQHLLEVSSKELVGESGTIDLH